MTRDRVRSFAGSAGLVALGIAGLVGSAPRVNLSATLPSCLTESPATAWLGLHLHLLTASEHCPEGTFAPGPHYQQVAEFSLALSLSTLLVATINLLLAVGFGLWVRRAARELGGRVRRWLDILEWSRHLPATAPVRATTASPSSRTSSWDDPCCRRGPPAASC